MRFAFAFSLVSMVFVIAPACGGDDNGVNGGSGAGGAGGSGASSYEAGADVTTRGGAAGVDAAAGGRAGTGGSAGADASAGGGGTGGGTGGSGGNAGGEVAQCGTQICDRALNYCRVNVPGAAGATGYSCTPRNGCNTCSCFVDAQTCTCVTDPIGLIVVTCRGV